jgi:hypothetical protein
MGSQEDADLSLLEAGWPWPWWLIHAENHASSISRPGGTGGPAFPGSFSSTRFIALGVRRKTQSAYLIAPLVGDYKRIFKACFRSQETGPHTCDAESRYLQVRCYFFALSDVDDLLDVDVLLV